jgi:DNA-binding MarR family transcriptional regulator
MMAETKGRGGKKPKYQIADIGGSDLTSEDISTERVLNFLIKGEMGAGEQSSPPAENSAGETSAAAPPTTPLVERVSQPDEAPQGQPVKKSLNHLFERAGSGGGGPAKDLKLKLSETQEAPVPSPPPQQTIVTEELTPTGHEQAGLSTEVTASLPEVTDKPATESAPTKSVRAEFDLTPYMELWKNFYRLKSGEIEALSSLFRMSHGEDSPECYVKMHNLAELSNLDYRYCQKVVRSLERLGWITKLQDYDPVTRLGVLYRVNLKPTQVA